MLDFNKIKLVIWDLDDTFWNGTISEGDIELPEKHIELIKILTDIGVINSICSKNDEAQVVEALKKYDLSEYFVFSSINWEAKGKRIKTLIEDMQLRAINALFIDDNHLNREEAKYYSDTLHVASPDIIEELYDWASKQEKKDLNHKRLNQYKVLETKREEKSKFDSNEEFLMESNIRLEIKNDCLNQLERIHDLILRSNQLNFTKVRSTKEELESLINTDGIESGYVSVSDRFGDYGIIGFYALKENSLIHFVFSCRTLGMGIEQYVYNYLNRPNLEIVPEVISNLDMVELPKWINQENVQETKASLMEIEGLEKNTVLIKGPCDLFQVYPYIANTDLFDTEFTYVRENLTIESTSHTTHIVESLRLNDEQKQKVIREVPFTDIGMYNDNIFKKPYKVVVISILTDANLGVYQRKETGEKLAFLEYIHPITDKNNWKLLINKEINCAGYSFNEDILKEFSDKYEFIGRNTPQQVVENLNYIRNHLNKDCLLAIMLGGELYYEKNEFPAYEDRHLVHKEMNDEIRKWANGQENVKLIDVNKYLIGQESFYDHFNHYVKPVYYSLAKEIVDLVNEKTGSKVKQTSKSKMIFIKTKEILAPYYYKIRDWRKR